jgi:hypothetical protein
VSTSGARPGIYGGKPGLVTLPDPVRGRTRILFSGLGSGVYWESPPNLREVTSRLPWPVGGNHESGPLKGVALEKLPYIPPFSADDLSQDLLVLFLEAVARVTPAFNELRDGISPNYYPRHTPFTEIAAWAQRWHLDFENYELRERVESWVYQVLDHWHHDSNSRKQLFVDLGWWKRPPKFKLSSDKRAEPVLMPQWNPDREAFESYATRMRAGFEKTLQEQRRTRESELERYGMRAYGKRAAKRSPAWDFEWLALSVCCAWSAGQIANRPQYGGVKSDAIKKALQKLRKDLHIDARGN